MHRKWAAARAACRVYIMLRMSDPAPAWVLAVLLCAILVVVWLVVVDGLRVGCVWLVVVWGLAPQPAMASATAIVGGMRRLIAVG